MNKPQNLIIDSNNLLHRAFWVSSQYNNISTPKMFFQCVRSYVKDHMITPGSVYTVWDDKLVRGSTNHRKQNQTVEYKSTRDHERNAKVYDTYPTIHKMCKHAGYHNMHPGVLEGDDVVAFLAKTLPGHNIIVTVDQDMLQLVNENTDVYNPIKKYIITHENFQQHMPVPREHFVKYKAAMGDKSDNIPGIPKVGAKRAQRLVETNFTGLSETDQEIVDRNIKLIDFNYSLTAYPGEVKLYQKQLDMVKSDPNVLNVEKFLQVCKQNDCHDINKTFVESLTIDTQPTINQILSC